ncbi:MAG: sugar phosphate isomerase/epimerase family protein [Kiritimatiellia bacterium]
MMEFAVSTHWNTFRHATGEAMIEEILALGVGAVELGYDLRADMVPGVKKMVDEGAVKVLSVHNFCPVPMGTHRGHPEIWTPASPDTRTRESAVYHITRTVEFAAEMGAKVVVAHAGNVDMSRFSRDLMEWCARGQQFSPAYEKLKMRAQLSRDKRAPKQIGYLRESIDRLLPELEKHQVMLAFENLPTWEAIPTEMEAEQLLQSYNSPWLRSWYDFGHGQIRQHLGFINTERWVERLTPWIAGAHIHDFLPPGQDHVMPPRGTIPFEFYREFANRDIVRVLEPAPGGDTEQLKEAIAFLGKCWQITQPSENQDETTGNEA